MIQLQYQAQVEIDDAMVRRVMDRRSARFLRGFGQAVVDEAKGSIRPAVDGKPSRPGQPPRSHTGRLRAGITYAMSADGKSVAIGVPGENSDGVSVPSLLEHGGRQVIRQRQRPDEPATAATAPAVAEPGKARKRAGVVRRATRRELDRYSKLTIRATTADAWRATTRGAWRSGGWGKVAAVALVIARPFLKPALDHAIYETVRFWERSIDD